MNKSLVVINLLLLSNIVLGNSFLNQADTLDIKSMNFTDSKTDSSIWINIDYPQIDGIEDSILASKINMFLEEEFKQSISWYEEMKTDSLLFEDYLSDMQFSFETGFQVEYNSKDFVSIVMSHYQFTGGAHGNYFALGYNINIEDGSIITLKDILNDGSIDLLTYECEETLLEKYEANSLLEAGLFENEISISDDQDFYIIPGAIVIQFDPYEIGPWVMGEITAEISFDKIVDILKDDIPFKVD